jgi:uncharacterized protein
MDRVFLDANVLFSAAYRPDSGLARLWDIKNTRLITSVYAQQEALSNLETEAQQERLKKLLETVEIIEHTAEDHLPPEINLPEKDRPILQAAIAARATHLLTGDIRHFGALLGKTVERVKVLLPAAYLNPQERSRGDA